MIKIIFLFIFLFLLNNCSDLEFVYKKNETFILKNLTDLNVGGEDSNDIYNSLKEKIEDNKKNDAKYKLVVNSQKTESAQVIDKDATASKFNIEYIITYEIYNLNKNCKIYKKQITTLSNYSAKSAGYSFGTDLSQKEGSIKNINKNINLFISSVNQELSSDSCT